jgi:hypothetical protein
MGKVSSLCLLLRTWKFFCPLILRLFFVSIADLRIYLFWNFFLSGKAFLVLPAFPSDCLQQDPVCHLHAITVKISGTHSIRSPTRKPIPNRSLSRRRRSPRPRLRCQRPPRPLSMQPPHQLLRHRRPSRQSLRCQPSLTTSRCCFRADP